MNIYLHIEISDRELDSKLLLGTLAASRGHDVIVSDLMGIMKGVKQERYLQEYFIQNHYRPIKIKLLDIS